MPIFKHPLPEALYRGRVVPCEGDAAHPAECPTCFGDPGRFVFASPEKAYALAYGLKACRTSAYIGRGFVDGACVPAALLLTTRKTFESLLREKTYLQRLDPAPFEAVFAREPTTDALPAEWVSRRAARILEIKIVENRELPNMGVQVFVTEDRGLFFSSTPSAAQALGKNLEAQALERGLKTGAITWINRTPPYVHEPKAQAPHLIKALELCPRAGARGRGAPCPLAPSP